jgi:hypothetical protein
MARWTRLCRGLISKPSRVLSVAAAKFSKPVMKKPRMPMRV